MGIQLEPREYVMIPTGSYPATVAAIEEAEGNFGSQLRWTLNLGVVEDVDGGEEERTLVGYTGQVLSSKAKLWTWVQATGLDPADGLNSDDLVGRRVVRDVVIEPRKDGQGEFNAIHAMLRPKTKAKPKPADDDDGSEL
jgi:hypothetical protein